MRARSWSGNLIGIKQIYLIKTHIIDVAFENIKKRKKKKLLKKAS
jgi:hypothetical protein